VKLFRTDGTLEASTQTDDAGHYSFIAPGNDYYIEVDLPTGYDFSPPYSAGAAIDSDITSTTATGGRTDTFTVTGGNTDTTRDIGLWSQIGDRVWEDLNANGVQDAGEPGIDGVSVRLLDSGGNPLTPPRTTTTAGGGYYGFSNLPNGSYIVEFAPPDSSYRFTAGDVGSDTFDSDVVTIPTIPGPGRTQPINIAGAIPPGHRADAGLYRLASIGDRVWIDIGGNARQQGNEPGVPGVIVRLFDSTDTEIISTTTDADGYYAFTEVEPASGYYLVFDMPTTDHRLVQPDQGTDNTRDSDAHPVTFRAPTTGGISLVSGQQDNSWDAGMPLAIGDFVWEDSNADGIQTPGELGLDGVTVNLYDSSYTLVATTTTAHGGRYGFTGLPDGWYRLEFVLPTNYSFTAPHLGTIWDDSDVDMNITPTSGFTDWITHTTTAFPNSWSDAGMLTTALDGRIWHDQDADGIYDMGQDGGIDGITVQLLNGSGVLLATTTTAGYGYYRFEGLSPGTYQLAPVLPPGASYMVSPRDQGADDEHDSEADPATGRIGPITLDANHVLYNLDAALYRAPSIGDRAWHDLDHDGVQDSDEPGFANLPVRLYREGELTPLASTTTATDGSYEFVGLQPGRYLVEFSLPPEYFFTIRDAPEADDATDSDADPATGRTEAIDVVSKPHTFDMHYDDLDAGLVN
jgi:protocatechuate 3,4-dioxygenase beta subunit